MRDKYELLLLLKDIYIRRDYFGLCAALNELHDSGNIKFKEYRYLRLIMYLKRPKGKEFGQFWWDMCDKDARLDFIETLKK